MKVKEQDIQKAVMNYLTLVGYFVFKNSTTGIYKKDTGHYIPAQTKGVADLTAIKNGKVVMLEIKTPTGKMSDNQKSFQQQWEAKGGRYICGGLDEIMANCK